jgi:peptidyl-dipeptidase Dcp
LSDAQVAAAAQAAQSREQKGHVLPLQNTTQQPDLASLSVRVTREAIFEKSWVRAERQVKVFHGQRDLIAIATRIAETLFHPKIVESSLT